MSDLPPIIGLSGYAQSGKDTVGQILQEDHGYTRMAFADLLREALYVLNPTVAMTLEYKSTPLRDLVDRFGWDHVKTNWYEVRVLLQRMGTEVGRELLGQDVWVNAALQRTSLNERVVFTDVRFPNEVRACRDHGGQVWRVERFGVKAANDHVSEVGLDDYAFEARIHNHTTLDNLRTEVHGALYYGRSE